MGCGVQKCVHRSIKMADYPAGGATREATVSRGASSITCRIGNQLPAVNLKISVPGIIRAGLFAYWRFLLYSDNPTSSMPGAMSQRCQTQAWRQVRFSVCLSQGALVLTCSSLRPHLNLFWVWPLSGRVANFSVGMSIIDS